MKKTALFASIFLFLFSVSVEGQYSINVLVGKKIHSVNNSISTITQTAMGQEIEIKSDVTITMDANIIQSTPDIILSIKIGRVRLKSEAMGNINEFDSDKSEDKSGPLGQLLSSVFNNSIDIGMTNTGKVNKAIKSSDPALETAKSTLGNFDEFVTEMIFPVKVDIKPGDSWIDDNTSDVDNKKVTEYKVVSSDNGEATLTFKGTSVVKANKSVQGMDAVVTSSSSFSGEMIVDIKSGVLKTKKTIIEQKGTTEVMGQSIPFSSTQITSTVNN